MDYLNFNEIVMKTKQDKNFPLKYLNELFCYHQNSYELPIKCSNPLAAIKCFVPLPSRFLLSELYVDEHKIIKLKDEYKFHGKPGNRIIFSEKILPFATNGEKIPIPFAFPIPQSDHIEIILSNVYYWEMTILEQQNLNYDLWVNNSPCVSVGFGDRNARFNSHVGWYDDSIGFHSDDGTIRKNITNNKGNVVSKPIEPGDTMGSGLIFCGSNQIKPFFTFNGKLVWLSDKAFDIKLPYFPMIGYDHPNTIQVNFSSKKFKFDIKNFIMENSKNIISTDNSFIANYDISYFLNHTPTNLSKIKKISPKIILPSGSLLNPIISPLNLLNLNLSAGSTLNTTPSNTLNLFSWSMNPNQWSINPKPTSNSNLYNILGIPILDSQSITTSTTVQLNHTQNSNLNNNSVTSISNLINLLEEFNNIEHDIIFTSSINNIEPDFEI